MSFEVPIESDLLPFDQNKQLALVGHIMQKEQFFKQVYQKLQPEWFSDSYAGDIYKYYCHFWEKRGRIPLSTDEFKDSDDFNLLDQQKRMLFYSRLGQCHTLTLKYGFDGLAPQLTAWQKMQVFCRNLPQIANLINSQKIQEAESLLKKTTASILESSFEGKRAVDWADWRAYREQAAFNMSNALSTGLTILDRKLLPEGESGGLLPGDTTIILAPTNAGKTSVMLTIARHNFFNGKSVLFVTREGNELDFVTKTQQSIFKKTRKELWTWQGTPEGEKALDTLALQMNNHFEYVHMPDVDICIEDVIADVQHRQNLHRARFGKGFDMLVLDYPGIFPSRESKGSKWEYRNVQDAIYRQVVQLGAQEKFHVLAAAQTNREGSKINKGYSAKRLLSFEDIAEAFGIAQSATNIITINRDVASQEAQLITFYLVKSRSSETGWAVTAKSDYARAMTHCDEFTATAYRGDSGMGDVIESLLKEYPNKDVPEGYRK